MAYALALLSSLLWGSADTAGGVLSRRLPAVAVVGWSQVAALVWVAVVAAVTRATAPVAGWLPWAVCAGLVGAGALVAFYAALAGGTMGVVSPIAALGGLVPFAAGVAEGDRPSAGQLAGALVALAGAVLASGPELRGAVGRRPVLLAVLAGLGFGTVLTLLSHGAQASVVLTLLGMRAASVACFATAAVLLRTAGGVGGRQLPALALVGVLDVGANLCYSVATTRGLLSLVAVLGSLYPVVTVVLARLLLHERMSRVQDVGCVAAIGGVVLVAAG